MVDGGHNPQGARALADSLADVFPGRKPVFVVGVLEDKDYPAMLETVLPLGAAFVCVAPDNPRALPADKLARAIRWTGQDLLGCSACTSPYVARDMADALARARELAGPDGLLRQPLLSGGGEGGARGDGVSGRKAAAGTLGPSSREPAAKAKPRPLQARNGRGGGAQPAAPAC